MWPYILNLRHAYIAFSIVIYNYTYIRNDTLYTSAYFHINNCWFGVGIISVTNSRVHMIIMIKIINRINCLWFVGTSCLTYLKQEIENECRLSNEIINVNLKKKVIWSTTVKGYIHKFQLMATRITRHQIKNKTTNVRTDCHNSSDVKLTFTLCI